MIYSIHDNNFRFSIRFVRVVRMKHLRNIDILYVKNLLGFGKCWKMAVLYRRTNKQKQHK